MEKGSQKGDDLKGQKGNGEQDSSRAFETEDKDMSLLKRDVKQRNKRKREASTEASNSEAEHFSEMAVRQLTNPPASTTNQSDGPVTGPSTLRITGRRPRPEPHASTLKRIEDVLKKKCKKRRTIASSREENNTVAREPTAEAQVAQSDNALSIRSPSTVYGNQGQLRRSNSIVVPEETNNVGDVRNERRDISAAGSNFYKGCEGPRLLPDSCIGEKSSPSPSKDSSRSASEEESRRTQGGNDGPDEKETNSAQKMEGSESRQVQRKEKGYRPLGLRTKRTLTGPRPEPEPFVLAISDHIWRLQYETGCLPGGPKKFKAPERQEHDVYESERRAGSVGFDLMAEKLGYTREEMMCLGGYAIEVDTDDRLEISWCPPESEYSRVIATRLPSNAGRWVVDVEHGFKYDGSLPFRMPTWRTFGPFQTIEDAVVEAKKQVGADRGWGWERVAMDSAFEIKRDNSTGWKGHWNPPGHEYFHTSVMMIGWPEPDPHTDYEASISTAWRPWRSAFCMAEDEYKTVHNRVD